MLGPVINPGLIIPLFAIAAPFVFVLLVIRMMTGSGRKRKARRDARNDETVETMNEIARGLRDLNRRIDNLETLRNRNKNKEQ